MSWPICIGTLRLDIFRGIGLAIVLRPRYALIAVGCVSVTLEVGR